MSNTIIRPIATVATIREWVDLLISPEYSDREARALAKLLLTVTDADNDDLYPLALAAAHHAFSKTLAFQESFEDFAELPRTTEERRRSDEFKENDETLLEIKGEQ